MTKKSKRKITKKRKTAMLHAIAIKRVGKKEVVKVVQVPQEVVAPHWWQRIFG